MKLIDLKQSITNALKKIWKIPMQIIEVAKIKVPLKTTKSWTRKILGSPKTTSRKTMSWFRLRSQVFHKFSSSSLLIFINLSPFSIIRAVESWAGTNIHPGTSRTIWNIRNNLIFTSNNGSQIAHKARGSFIRRGPISITILSMTKIRFNKTKGHLTHIRHNNRNTIGCRDLTQLSLHHKEIYLIAIFHQLNSDQDQQWGLKKRFKIRRYHCQTLKIRKSRWLLFLTRGKIHSDGPK